jgi:glycosyltransferase involved in cell wall biosynthesis
MKVGVYFPGFPPEAGGGYTFEQSILTSLINLASQSHHHFTFFVDNVSLSNVPAIINTGIIKTVLLGQPARVSNSQVLLRKAGKKIGWKRQTGNPESPFQKAAEREQIEFVWFITPIYSPIEIPYIATVWDIQHRIQPWFPEVSRMGEWAHREAFYSTHLRRATYIITPNQAGMKELSFIYQIPMERFRLLPHPTPEIGQLPSTKEITNVLKKYQIPSNYLFYPGQFWAHKNHANLLLALQSLRDNYKTAMHLVLVGSNQGNLQYIQNLAEQLRLKDQVHFLGFIPREDLIALYCGAFALVYVTLFGPENLPPLEAFACGCPVIASNVAGAQDQLGDAALLVNGLAPEEIAFAIKKIYDDSSLREDLIKKGHARAANFTCPNFVNGVFGMLDEFEPVRRNWKF